MNKCQFFQLPSVPGLPVVFFAVIQTGCIVGATVRLRMNVPAQRWITLHATCRPQLPEPKPKSTLEAYWAGSVSASVQRAYRSGNCAGARAPFCTERCRTQNHRVNADFCQPCQKAIEAEAERLLQPFCACGRVIGECDGSRTGCRRSGPRSVGGKQ